MVTLYEHPLSPYAQKNKIALREKGIAFELATPDALGSGTVDAAFLNANPRGEVPALIDDQVAVFDSTIILEYIEDKWPTPPLLPDGAEERARVRMIEDVMDTQVEAINWGISEVVNFGRAKDGQAETILAKAADQTQNVFVWLEKQLGNRGWFNGEAFGWADLSVIPHVNGAASFGNLPPEGSRLAAWAARMNARPSVAETAKEAADSASAMSAVAKIVEQGSFKREYRDHRLEWMIKTTGLDIVSAGLKNKNIRFSNDIS